MSIQKNNIDLNIEKQLDSDSDNENIEENIELEVTSNLFVRLLEKDKFIKYKELILELFLQKKAKKKFFKSKQ